MVKESNQRVMVTLSKETAKIVDEVATTYGLTKSSAIAMMIVVFHKSIAERSK